MFLGRNILFLKKFFNLEKQYFIFFNIFYDFADDLGSDNDI